MPCLARKRADILYHVCALLGEMPSLGAEMYVRHVKYTYGVSDIDFVTRDDAARLEEVIDHLCSGLAIFQLNSVGRDYRVSRVPKPTSSLVSQVCV